jgi:hypothetical protein
MGAYTACLDIALGIAGRALGLVVASGAGLGAVFLASSIVVLCSAAVALQLLDRPAPRHKTDFCPSGRARPPVDQTIKPRTILLDPHI